MANLPDALALQTWPPARTQAEWDVAVALLGRLTEANLHSLHLAKRLMRAQELADAESVRAERAIDHAVAASGDTEAIDAAVGAVRDAHLAGEVEDQLSYSWAVHRCEVARLTQVARALVRRSSSSPSDSDREKGSAR